MSWRVTGRPGWARLPPAGPSTKIARSRAARRGHFGPWARGWVMSALKTMMSVALRAAPMVPSACPRAWKPSRREVISRRASTVSPVVSDGRRAAAGSGWPAMSRVGARYSVTGSRPGQVAAGVFAVEAADANVVPAAIRRRHVAFAHRGRGNRGQHALTVGLGVAPGTARPARRRPLRTLDLPGGGHGSSILLHPAEMPVKIPRNYEQHAAGRGT
jgi:hypothetical protein